MRGHTLTEQPGDLLLPGGEIVFLPRGLHDLFLRIGALIKEVSVHVVQNGECQTKTRFFRVREWHIPLPVNGNDHPICPEQIKEAEAPGVFQPDRIDVALFEFAIGDIGPADDLREVEAGVNARVKSVLLRGCALADSVYDEVRRRLSE